MVGGGDALLEGGDSAMDTVATYRQLIQQLLAEHAGLVWDKLFGI